MKPSLSVLLVVALLGLASVASAARTPFVGIIADENGHALITNGLSFSPLLFAVTSDPGPGGQADVLTYDLDGPPSLVAGDVLLTEPGSPDLSDIIRFNSAGTGGNLDYPASFLIYSDQDEKTLSLADGSPFPTSFYANTLTLPEQGTEGDSGVQYTPTEGQPGFVGGFDVTYVIFSDGSFVTPEPSSLAAFGIGALFFGGLALYARRRSRLTASA